MTNLRRALFVAAALGAMVTQASEHALSISIGDLSLPGDLRLRGLSLTCAQLTVADAALECPTAILRIDEGPLGRLRVPMTARLQAGRYTLGARRFALAGGEFAATLDVDGARRRLRVTAHDVDLANLQALARSAQPALQAVDLSTGRLDLVLDCTLDGTRPGDCNASGRIRALDVAGASSAEAATISFDLGQRRSAGGEAWRGHVVLEAGTLYLEPGVQIGSLTPGLLLKVDDGPIAADFVAARDRGGSIRLSHGQLDHPGVAQIVFDGAATLSPTLGWQEAALNFSTTALSRLYAIYLQPLLLGSSLGSLTAGGGLDVALRVKQGRIAELDVDCRACTVDDEAQRFAIADLNGGLRLHAGATPLSSTLSWGSASVYRLALGAGRVDWASSGGQLQAVAWQDVSIFDGALHLDTMQLVDFGTSRTKLVLGGRIDPITLSQLTTSFGWPAAEAHDFAPPDQRRRRSRHRGVWWAHLTEESAAHGFHQRRAARAHRCRRARSRSRSTDQHLLVW